MTYMLFSMQSSPQCSRCTRETGQNHNAPTRSLPFPPPFQAQEAPSNILSDLTT